MSKLVSHCYLALVLALCAAAASARTVQGLYAASVPVADQSEQSLRAASAEALAEVLVKVTGKSAVLENPGLADALERARSHVQQYVYRRDGPGQGLQARLEFDPADVRRLVLEAGEPLWTAERPPVLLWLVVDGTDGRHFVNREVAPAQLREITQAFARRGVPVQLPLFDLADTAGLDIAQAWRLDGRALRAASGRYGGEHIVAGRAALPGALSEPGALRGEWSYFSGGARSDRSFKGEDLASFAAAGANLVAETMAARYAVAPSESGAGQLTMQITGVETYADYAGVVSWLRGLELIDQVSVVRIADDRLELRLEARADRAQLATLFELNARLRPAGAATAAGLRYHWQH